MNIYWFNAAFKKEKIYIRKGIVDEYENRNIRIWQSWQRN